MLAFIVPTPLVGEGTIYSNGFFLFSQFWPIDIFIAEKCDLVSLKSSYSLEFEIKRSFLNFVFFEELSRIEVLCEHVIFGIISFPFSVIFQIMIFSLQIFLSKLHFTPQKE